MDFTFGSAVTCLNVNGNGEIVPATGGDGTGRADGGTAIVATAIGVRKRKRERERERERSESLEVFDVQIEILVGILNLYYLIGFAAAGCTSDWNGRQYTIALASTIFFTGALLMGFATNYFFLMVGRFVARIGVGYGLMIAPVYTAEVSSASSRGFLERKSYY